MNLSKQNFKKARDFILTNARMIERRLFHYYFENQDPKGIYHAIYAYRNSDGGFGHGMEPDTASPESQPLFTIMAMETLDEVGLLNTEQIESDFLPYFESIITQQGGVPWMFKPISDYPCEPHFKLVKEWAALSTTAPLLGMLEKYNVQRTWMEKAESFVWSEFERILDKHVFCYLCVPRWLFFLKHSKNKAKAEQMISRLKHSIIENNVLCNDTSDEGWGLYQKPHSLNYAPHPNSLLSDLFSEDQINSDLTTLIQKQKEDGRWDTWYGISEGTKLEWAGIHTVWALKVLKDYGRID